MKTKITDLSEEMKKEPQDRAPGTFDELLKQALKYGAEQEAKQHEDKE